MINYCISLSKSSYWFPRFPSLKTSVNNTDTKVIDQAGSALGSLAVSFAFTTYGRMLFGALPVTIGFSNLLIFLGAVRITAAVAKYLLDRFRGDRLEPLNDDLIKSTHRIAVNNVVQGVGAAGLNALFHEIGHFLAISACVKGSNPRITIAPFLGGGTRWLDTGKLTLFGSLLGNQNARLLITLAGLMASLTVAMVDFAMARAWKKSRPTLSVVLHSHGVSQLFTEILYGIGSLTERFGQDDFTKARELAGIHPALIIFLLIAIPLAQHKLMKQLNKPEET